MSRPGLSTTEREARALLGGIRGRTPGARVPDSFPDRILRFFAENPDEELTYRDIAAKFSVTIKLAHSTVNYLTRTEKLHTATVVRKGRAS